jgi:hypothetical protein
MRLLAALWTSTTLVLGACTSTPPAGPAPATPLPDGRDLAEQPLDVINLPQP